MSGVAGALGNRLFGGSSAATQFAGNGALSMAGDYAVSKVEGTKYSAGESFLMGGAGSLIGGALGNWAKGATTGQVAGVATAYEYYRQPLNIDARVQAKKDWVKGQASDAWDSVAGAGSKLWTETKKDARRVG